MFTKSSNKKWILEIVFIMLRWSSMFMTIRIMAAIQEYILYFLIWLIASIFVHVMIRRKSAARLPPSPFALPIVGHLHLLAPIPHQALHKLSVRYGPLIHLFLGSVPSVVVSSPDMAREFLKTHENSWSDRPRNFAVDYLTYGSQDFSFAPYGAYWKFMKKLCMQELLGGKTLDLLNPVRRDEIRRLVEYISVFAKEGKQIDIGSELLRFSNNVISRMIMSKRCSADKKEAGDIQHLVKDIAQLTGMFNVSDYIWFCKNLDLQGIKKRLVVVRNRFDDMLDKIIKDHQEAREKRKNNGGEEMKDLLHVLLDVSEDENAESRLSRENLKAFILDLFAAGTDTSAITIEWALSELINHPNMMKRAAEEIDLVTGKNRLVEESDIENLPFLQAIVKETLRLHPTGPMIVRESNEDSFIAGYHIPAKTTLFVNVWAINRDPDSWDNPLEYNPERFMTSIEGNGKGQLDVRGQHFHFLPFGTGRRGCPGTSLALRVIQTTLATMIQCFKWKVDGIIDMEEGPGITLPRAHALVCVPISRMNQIPLL